MSLFCGVRVSLCIPDWPGTCFVVQANVELTAVCLRLLPDAVTKGVSPHAQLATVPSEGPDLYTRKLLVHDVSV